MSLSQQPHAKYNGHYAYTAKQVLTNEALVAKKQKLAMYELMERAGTTAFKALKKRWPKTTHVLILAGKGNNGGDGFIVARLAYLANIQVTVLVTTDVKSIKGDALIAYQAMLEVGVSQIVTHNLAKHISKFSGDVIVDALFGIGFYGRLTESMQQLVTIINEQAASVLSIDIPSGLCATTGLVSEKHAVVADMTVTFIVYKQGLLTGQAANFVGDLILADIGLGAAFKNFLPSNTVYQLNSPQLKHAGPLKKRANTAHKGDVGQVLAVGGDKGMSGAIRLASEAALRCGAALVSVCCHTKNQIFVANGRPELMLAPCEAKQLADSTAMKKANVLLLGPGLGQTAWSKDLFDLAMSKFIDYDALKSDTKWLVIDADGLTLLAKTKCYSDRFILTPHPKEAARLLNCDVQSIEADRFNAVQAIAKKYGGICILKGAGSLISNGEHTVINSTGNAGMASGGMGDVLAGIVAALTLQADDYFAAVCLAVYIHGAAGDIIANNHGQRGMLASDLFAPLQKLVNQCPIRGHSRIEDY